MSMIDASMLPALLGRPVAYQPVFTRLPGVTVQGVIFLSQALFLTNTPKRQGWFYKDQEGSEDSGEFETGMSAKQQATARKPLREVGVLEEVRKGMPAKCWYRVNLARLAQLLVEALSDDKQQKEVPEKLQNTPPSPVVSCFAQREKQETPNRRRKILPMGAADSPFGRFLYRDYSRESLSPLASLRVRKFSTRPANKATMASR